MLIRRRQPWDLPANEVTDEALYLRRREFLRGAAVLTGALLLPGCQSNGDGPVAAATEVPSALASIAGVVKGPFGTDEAQTSERDATSYNNFYEFGTDKTDPKENAGSLITKPWSVKIDGEVGKPGTVALEDLLKGHTPEERVYRHRCVEAWSLVIPWIGIPFGEVL